MNISKKVFIMVAMMATIVGYANDGYFFINKKDAKKTVLTLSDVKVGNLFTIRDTNDLILYEETIQKPGVYMKGFNLTALPDGIYFFELDKDMEVKSIPFSIEQGKVAYSYTSFETVFKPTTVIKNNVIYISKLSLNEAPLKVEIYKDEGAYKPYKLIHSETLTTSSKNLKRAYKIKDETVGNYKIIYKTEGKEFTQFI